MRHGTPLRIGTRASALALWQARYVAAAISRQSDAPAVELVHISTEGDVRTDVPLWSVGGKAFFTKEIDRALLAREIDVAVHSLKDLATQLEPGTVLAAVLAREDPRDALVSRDGVLLHELPPGARVGSSSLRRRAFLAHARPDLNVGRAAWQCADAHREAQGRRLRRDHSRNRGSEALGACGTYHLRALRGGVSAGGLAGRASACACAPMMLPATALGRLRSTIARHA